MSDNETWIDSTSEISLKMSEEEDEIFSPPPFTPPPVAPLPPPPPFSRTAVTATNGIQREVSFSNYGNDPDSDGQRAHKYAASLIPDSLDSYNCVSYQRYVDPILQSGPQCGLVALCMANSVLKKGVTVEMLADLSQKKGYSKQGEMFSAKDMEALTAEAFGYRTSILDVRNIGGKWEFLNCLARGDLLLVPYDPDKNYVPVLKKGHKAHWALVTGFFAALKEENISDKFPRSITRQDVTIRNLYHCSKAPLPPHVKGVNVSGSLSTPRALSANVPVRSHVSTISRAVSAATVPVRNPTETDSKASGESLLAQESLVHPVPGSGSNPLETASYILVYAKQGKSKHTGIWNAKTLVESCCNLLEVNPERLEDGDMYKLPEKGIAEDLCGKVVVMHVKV